MAYALLVADAERFSGGGSGRCRVTIIRGRAGTTGCRADAGEQALGAKANPAVPIRDEVVGTVLGLGREFWEPLRQTLRSRTALSTAGSGGFMPRPGCRRKSPRLRVLDVLAWSEGKDRGLLAASSDRRKQVGEPPVVALERRDDPGCRALSVAKDVEVGLTGASAAHVVQVGTAQPDRDVGLAAHVRRQNAAGDERGPGA